MKKVMPVVSLISPGEEDMGDIIDPTPKLLFSKKDIKWLKFIFLASCVNMQKIKTA